MIFNLILVALSRADGADRNTHIGRVGDELFVAGFTAFT